jgi:long-chain acyl-CoA synthetase
VIESLDRPVDERPARPWLANYDAGVPADVEIPDISVDQLLRRSADAHPTRVAMDFYGRHTTYAELDRLVDGFAGLLHGAGLGRGDSVSLHLPTSPAFVIAFLGTLRAGCVASAMSPLYVERELTVLMRQTRPRLSVTLDVLLPRVEGARAQLDPTVRPPDGLAPVIVTGIQDSLPLPLRWLYPIKMRREGRWHPVAHTTATPNLFRLLSGASTERVDSPAGPGDPAVFQATGGTTGTPKEAVLSHRNLVANAVQCQAVLAGGGDEAAAVLCALPYFHIYGLTVAMTFALVLGATQVLLPRFEPDAVLKAIDRHQPRYFPGVPSMYAALNRHPRVRDHDLRSIQACISGAAPLPSTVQAEFEALTGGSLCEGYGLTEASPVTHVNPIRGHRRPGTIGLPLPGTDVRLMDLATGADVAGPGKVGELCVRGPQVMTGYYERPEETGRVLRDGWLHTGDLATMDADGYFSIVDRIKDVVIVSGANVYPREVEEVLITHPDVAEAAVVGMKSATKGEVPKAFVVLREGATTDVEELKAYCAQNLASYKRPAVIEVRVSLPRSMVGKVLRRELIAEERAGEAPSAADQG